MSNSTLTKNYSAEADIPAYRIIKSGAKDNGIALAATATDYIMGVNESIAAKSGERIDVIKSGIADVEFGGAVVRGQPVTSDGAGRAIAATPAAGANMRILGYAEKSAIAGDIAPVLIGVGQIKG